jgi:hypothetical protein
MTSLEAAASRSITNSTLKKLDNGLDWVPGTAARVLAGEVKPSTAARDPRHDRRRISETDFPSATDATRSQVDTSYLGRLLDAKAKPLEERTAEDDELVRGSMEWRVRAETSAWRAAAERPLVDLVEDGQRLVSRVDDNAVRAYVRKVEAYVVSEMGIERLTAELDARLSERLIVRANSGGVLDEFMEQIDRLRASGIEGRELLQRLSRWLDAALNKSDDDALLRELKDGLREMVDRYEANPERFGTADVDSSDRRLDIHPDAVAASKSDVAWSRGAELDIEQGEEPPALADAARTAPPGYRKGRGEQGDAGGEENQDAGVDAP